MPEVMKRTDDGSVLWECPGCGCAHGLREGPGGRLVAFEGDGGWSWNGDLERPTVSPSLKHTYSFSAEERERRVCHYFIRDGQLEFCPDSTHELAGQVVPMTPWE